MTLLTCAARSALVALVLVSGVVPARADDVKVFSSVAMRAVVEELAQRFEREGRHHVVATFGLAAAMKSRIEAGEAFDLVTVTPAQIDDLIKQGKATAASRAVIARTGLGLMVRAGSPKLDVGTVDAFKRTLLSAKSIAYAKEGASGVLFASLLQRLGIAADLQARSRLTASGEEVSAAVVKGDVEFGVLPLSEVLPVKGEEPVMFPADAQSYIVMVGGVNAASKHAAAARELIQYVTASAALPVLKAKGMER